MKKNFTSFLALYFMMISFAPQIVQASSYNHSSTVSAPMGISVDTSGPDLAPPPESQFWGFILGAIAIVIVDAATAALWGVTTALIYESFIKGP